MEFINTWDNIRSAKQDWQMVKYDSKNKKWIQRPVFFIKYRWSNRYERISIKEAVNLIGDIFPLSEQLREWVGNSKYSHLLKQ